MSSETIRRYAQLLSVVVIVCALPAFVTGCSGRRSQQQTEIGNTFLGIGKLAEARQAFEQAIELNPENMEAELGLARCLAAQDNLDEALEHYQTVIDRQPSIGAAYEEAARLLLRRERNAEALELATAYENIDPLKGGLLRASILRSTGRPGEAVVLLEELTQTFPESVDIRISLASAHMEAGADAKAVEVLEDVLETLDPNSLSARMKLVEVYEKQGKIDQAIDQLRAMVEQQPDDPGLRLALARGLINKGEYEEAEEIGRSVLYESPESGWANYVVGACILARGQREEAIPYLQTAAQALPNFETVQTHLAQARSGQAEESGLEESTAPRPEQSPPRPDMAAERDLSWQTLWKQAQFDQLLEQSDAFLAGEEPNVRETLVLAALFNGNRERARQLAEGLPPDAPLVALITALEKREPEAVVNVFDSWTETDPERVILRDNAYGFALTLMGARAKAMQELAALYAKSPENAVALFNLATLYRTAQLPQYASQVLDRLLSLYPNNLGARRLLLALLIENGDLQRARAVAELTYQLYPDKPRAVVDIARIYRITGELDLAESILKNALGTMPENAGVRIAQAQIQLLKGEPDAALRTLDGAVFDAALSPTSETLRAFALALKNDWAAVTQTCAAVPADARSLSAHLLDVAGHMHQGNAGAAARVLTQAEDIPWSRVKGADVVRAALGTGEAPTDAESLVTQLKAHPDALAAYAFGMACMAEALPDATFAAFEKAASIIPDSPALTVLLLDALGTAHRIEAPEQKAERLVNRVPDAPGAWLALAEFYRAKKNTEAEGAALQKAIALDENNLAAWVLQARYLERQNDKEGAIAAYERVVALSPGDPVMNNNLAYLLLETKGDVRRALELARDALEKANDNPVIQPHVLHTLGLAELRAEKLDEAEKHLGLALQMRPGDPTLLLDYGNLLIKKGDSEAGQRQIRRAIEYAERFGLEFSRKAEAEELLAAETS